MPIVHSLHKITVGNGIEGYLVDVPGSPAMSYEVSFNGGNHQARILGMPLQTSHVLEHILCGWVDDPKFPTRTSFAKEFRKNGAYSNGHTNPGFNWYDGSTVIGEWRRVMDMVKLSLIRPRINDDALTAEAGNASEEIRRNIGDNGRLAYELALSLLSPDVTPSSDAVRSIDETTIDNLTAYYTSVYGRNNLRFIVAGDFGGDTAEITEYFSGWKDLDEGKLIQRDSVPLKAVKSWQYVERESLQTVYVQLTMGVNRKLSAKELLVLRIINAYLFNDTTSKITYQAREKGWCYGLGTYVDKIYGQSTLLSVAAPISARNLKRMFELVVTEVRDCAYGTLEKRDVDATKAFSIGRFTRFGQKTEELIDMYEDYRDGDLIHADERLELLQSVTPDDVQALLGEILQSGVWSFAGVGGKAEAEFKEAYDVVKGLFA